MTQEYVIHLAREALSLALFLAAPALGFGLVVGLVISILQATTQIQEQTLIFVPKIVAVMLAMLIFGSWMLSALVSFAAEVFSSISTVVR